MVAMSQLRAAGLFRIILFFSVFSKGNAQKSTVFGGMREVGEKMERRRAGRL